MSISSPADATRPDARPTWPGSRAHARGGVRRAPSPKVVVGMLVALFLLRPHWLIAQNGVRCEASKRVLSIAFRGSPHFADDTLAAAIATRGPTFLNRVGIGAPPCTDSLEVEADAIRLAVLHRRAGWFMAAVLPRFDRTPRGTRIRFDIVPGPEAILDTLRIDGLPPDTVRAGLAAAIGPLRSLRGQRFDRGRVENDLAVSVERLRDLGYARITRPANTIVIDTATARVTLSLTFAPGARLILGAIRVSAEGAGRDPPESDSADVMRLIDLRSGQTFSGSAIVAAQRELYRSEAFRLVLVDTATVPPPLTDSVIDLRIRVAEAKTRYGRTGVGWATQDCLRVQGRVADRTFLGIGRRAELNVRASKIGVGAPADFAPNLCAFTVRTDTFSLKLNYYAGLSVSDNRLFGVPLSPVFSLYSERRSEFRAYLRETAIGALFEITRTLGALTRINAGLQYENGRTETSPVLSCSRFGQCRPDEYALNRFGRGIGIVSGSVTHDRTAGAVDPQRGKRVRAELRAGQTSSDTVSSLRFYRPTTEGAVYRRTLGGVVAVRAQLSQVFAPGARLVDGSPLLPQQERLFAGGQNSVRGYQQNLLGPLVYVVSSAMGTPVGTDSVFVVDPRSSYDAIPRGGTALAVANVEYRRPLSVFAQQLQFAAFVDVGNVWETSSGGFRSKDLRFTPGAGLRLVTPLGPFRVDIGYSPYPPRAGRALYFASGTIRCASPRTPSAASTADEIRTCPETYQPVAKTVLSRLVFHFGLGQAF